MDALGNVQAVIAECTLVTTGGVGTAAYEIDLRKFYVSPGKREVMAVLTAIAPASASCTLYTPKFTEASSSATAGSNYTDVTSGAFTGVTAAAGAAITRQQIFFGLHPDKPFVRIYNTITGGKINASIVLFMVKRIS